MLPYYKLEYRSDQNIGCPLTLNWPNNGSECAKDRYKNEGRLVVFLFFSGEKMSTYIPVYAIFIGVILLNILHSFF